MYIYHWYRDHLTSSLLSSFPDFLSIVSGTRVIFYDIHESTLMKKDVTTGRIVTQITFAKGFQRTLVRLKHLTSIVGLP